MKQSLIFKAEGSAFKDGSYDLRYLEFLLSNYRQLIDITISVLLGYNKLNKRKLENLSYRVDIKPGSIIIDLLEPFINNPELLLPLIADGGALVFNSISNLFYSTMNFRRAFTTILESNINPRINLDNSNNHNYEVNSNLNNGIIALNSPLTIILADNSKNIIDRMLNKVDGNNLSTIELKSDQVSTIINADDKRLTGTQKEELTSSIEIVGRLDMVNFSTHRGRIVSNNNRYPVLWDENLRSVIQQFVDVEDILYIVRPIIDRRRFKDDPIAFHIINCNNQQTEIQY